MDGEIESAESGNSLNCQSLLQTLNQFRLSNILCDVTIVDDFNETTHAHSCILAASSPVLKQTIQLKDTNKHLMGQGLSLKMGDIAMNVWRLLLEYIYLNTLVIPAVPGLLERVLTAARMLGMKELVSVIVSHMTSVGMEESVPLQVPPLRVTLASTRPRNIAHVETQTDAPVVKKAVKAPQAPGSFASPAEPVFELASDTTAMLGSEAVDVLDANRVLKCRFCRMQFDRRANLVTHVADFCSALEKPFLPSALEESKASADASEAGLDSRSDGRVYKCINMSCGELFGTSTALKRHSWKCILGADSVQPVEQLHEMPDSSIIYSDGLDASQIEEGAAIQPMAYLVESSRQLPAKSRLYQCSLCPHTQKRERMAAHLAVHHGKRRPYSCRECGMRYGYFDSLRDHYVGMHTVQQFSCTECGKVFKRHIALRRHMLYEHLREEALIYPCAGCGKKFKKLEHARRHELYHNPNDARRRFKCQECNKLFCTKQECERHVEGVHINYKPFHCQYCNYSTPRKAYLLQHERKHGVVDGRFLCVVCNKAFVSEAFFNSHLREKHPGTTATKLETDVFQGGELNGQSLMYVGVAADSSNTLVLADDLQSVVLGPPAHTAAHTLLFTEPQHSTAAPVSAAIQAQMLFKYISAPNLPPP